MTTATQIDFYSQALDEAWTKLEESIVAMQALNETLWEGDKLVQHAPGADIHLLLAKLKELQGEMGNFESAREPIRIRRVLLPGEKDLV